MAGAAAERDAQRQGGERPSDEQPRHGGAAAEPRGPRATSGHWPRPRPGRRACGDEATGAPVGAVQTGHLHTFLETVTGAGLDGQAAQVQARCRGGGSRP